jgi:YD repeat-containing protein
VPERAAAPQPAVQAECNPRLPCPRGFGVCLRCDLAGDRMWEWSDALGAANAIWPITSAIPDCRRFTFDAHGNPLALRPNGLDSTIRWSYDAQGRVTQIGTDEPKMCRTDFGDFTACGPPDGVDDSVTSLVWTTDGALSVVRSVGGNPSWNMAWDADGRLVRSEGAESVSYEYTGHDPLPVREVRGSQVIEWQYTANGRPLVRTVTKNGKPAGRMTWAYDDHGHQLGEQTTWEGDSVVRKGEWIWQYGPHGRPARVTTHDATGKEFVRIYDERGLLQSFSTAGGFSVAVRRAADGRLLGTDQADFECLAPLWDQLAR